MGFIKHSDGSIASVIMTVPESIEEDTNKNLEKAKQLAAEQEQKQKDSKPN